MVFFVGEKGSLGRLSGFLSVRMRASISVDAFELLSEFIGALSYGAFLEVHLRFALAG
jgi:hypothetical protein